MTKATTRKDHIDEVLASPDRIAKVQKRTIKVLIITQIVGALGVGVGPSIGIVMAGEVMNDEMWAGLARVSSTLGAALFGLPLGTLAARRGRRVALATGWWLASAGALILVAAAQWSLAIPLFVGLFLLGAGGAVSLQARFAATDLAEPMHKARALAMVVWVGTLGSIIGPNMGIPGEWLAGFTSFTTSSAAFLFAGVFLFLGGTLVFALLRPDPLLILLRQTARDAGPTPTGFKARFVMMGRELRVNKPARLAVIAIIVSQSVMAAMMTMAPVHIMHQEGGNLTIVGITISLHVVGMYALSPVAGIIADRIGHRASMWLGVALFMASLLVGVFLAHDLTWVMVCLFLVGVGWCFVNVAGSALFSTVVAPQVRAPAQGGVDATSNLISAFAAFIAGPLLVFTNFSVLSIVAMVVLLPLVLVILRPFPAVRVEDPQAPGTETLVGETAETAEAEKPAESR